MDEADRGTRDKDVEGSILSELREILKDDEITALTAVYFVCGSIREAASYLGVSRSALHRTINGAHAKLLAAGKHMNVPQRVATRMMDPAKMDREFSSDRRYNARESTDE